MRTRSRFGNHRHPVNIEHHDRADRATIAAERFVATFGSIRFLAWQTVVIIGWVALNVVAYAMAWDPYPFILLNLVFSTQAAYAAPLILFAQGRQSERDRSKAEHDYGVNEQTLELQHQHATVLGDTQLLVRNIHELVVRLFDE